MAGQAQTQAQARITVRLCAIPGGGTAAYAPAGQVHAGDVVTLTSKAKGDRPGRLTASLGSVLTPFAGSVEFFAYQADK